MPKHPYGVLDAGHSYEWLQVYLSLKDQYKSSYFFDFLSEYQQSGREQMQNALLEQVKLICPNIILFALYKHEFDPDFITSLQTFSHTFCFFMDDTWRIAHVKKYALCFSAFSTTSHIGEITYKEIGLKHANFLPDGVNTDLFQCRNQSRDIDISFIGSWHAQRQWIVNRLRKAGLNISTYGSRWPKQSLSLNEMIDVLNRSKISLNLSNSTSWDCRYFLQYPRGIINTFRSHKKGEQIKGRHFEIPACGAMQISFYTPGLGSIFQIDKEIVVFNDIEELIHQVRFYLKYPEERERIAQAGYERTMREHNYPQRFEALFRKLGWL